MKVRNDYVSNSSSSSFIVISKDGKDCTDEILESFDKYSKSWCSYEFPCKQHKHEFGWEFEDTRDFGGKLNFIGIQLLYLMGCNLNGESCGYGSSKINPEKEFTRCYDMVKKVCLEKFGLKVGLDMSFLVARVADDKDDNGNYSVGFSIQDVYIDHQSAVTEGCCMEMFSSEQNLYDFLRSEDSYIRGGNDNE